MHLAHHELQYIVNVFVALVIVPDDVIIDIICTSVTRLLWLEKQSVLGRCGIMLCNSQQR